MKFSVNTGFLVNRYPSPDQWCLIIKELQVKNIQITADLFNPYYPDHILDEQVQSINQMSNKFGFNVYSAFTGAFTRVNHFCHPDEKVREYWLEWFTKFAKYTSKLGAKRIGSHIGILSIPDNLNSRSIFQSRCIEYWKRFSSIAKGFGFKELSWEHMSISREQGHTCEDIDFLLGELKNTDIPIKLCLDPDHGDLSSDKPEDYEPYGLIKKYISYANQLHLKQTTYDNRKNGPVIASNNEKGLIKAGKVLEFIDKYNLPENEDLELILELNAREREPDDSEIVNNVRESVRYWEKALIEKNIMYD